MRLLPNDLPAAVALTIVAIDAVLPAGQTRVKA
jgi:hypothetical protein